MSKQNQYHNILISHLKHIGDVLLALPAIDLLRQANPGARITVLALPRVAPLLVGHPYVDEVIAFEYQSRSISWRQMLDMAMHLRRVRYDLYLSFDFRIRPLLAALLAGIPVRVSGAELYQFKRKWYRGLFTQLIPIDGQHTHDHQSLTFEKIVRGFFSVPAEWRGKMILPVTERAQEHVAQLLSVCELHKKKIALCVHGMYVEKDWPPEYFAQVVELIAAVLPACFYLVGAASDRAYAQAVAGACAVPLFDFSGKTDLLDVAALMAETDLLISVDTGVAHLAATTQTPIISIFRRTSPIQWRPLSNHLHLFCYKWVDEQFGLPADVPCKVYPDVLPEAVAAEALDLLGGAKA